MTSREPRKHRISPAPLLFLLAGVVAVWALYWLVVILFPFQGEFWDARGKFGDMFGGFNALFTACAFAAIIFGIRLEYKASLRQELHTALSAQLDTLVQLYAMPEAQRAPVWRAIITAPGGPGENFPIERAIANHIDYMDRLMAGEDLDFVPIYGRPPNA
jgi:hypothetical protein